MYAIRSYYAFGPTLANPVVSEFHTVLNQSQTEFNDKIQPGFFIGLGVSRNLWKSINGTIGFRWASYNYSFHETTTTTIGDENLPFAKLQAEENIRSLDIPISLNYTLGKGNMHYVAMLGIQGSFLRKAQLSLTRSQQEMRETLSESDIDIQDYRSSFVPMVVTGLV